MAYARLRVDLPNTLWVARLSRRYGDATVTVLSMVAAKSDVVTLLEIEGIAADDVREAGRTDPEVTAFDEVVETPTRLLVSYRIRSRLYSAAERAGVPPLYPIEIRDGLAHIELTTAKESLGALCAELEKAGGSVEILTLRTESKGRPGLTDRQRELLAAAYDRGYYNSPRECSLADLAADFDVTPSTVSDVLRRAERAAVSSTLGAEDS
ncbi:helix-turn-helix domain-containing protein [Haloarchaeobius amylolyticus]|uniref:helix-turn-helix domain-containing protein n=1 Tax=Haloarchaeobius amylolyticus TaxID=1198296 RepID=UPI00226F9239|nr:helix-turn-helix domain-containing protein [Haloarchaeobius amylolyticus]